jgi:hypothetical protein
LGLAPNLELGPSSFFFLYSILDFLDVEKNLNGAKKEKPSFSLAQKSKLS